MGNPSTVCVRIEVDGELHREVTVSEVGSASVRPTPERYKDGRVKPLDKQPVAYREWDENLRRYEWASGGHSGEFVLHAEMDGVDGVARRGLLEAKVADREGLWW